MLNIYADTPVERISNEQVPSLPPLQPRSPWIHIVLDVDLQLHQLQDTVLS